MKKEQRFYDFSCDDSCNIKRGFNVHGGRLTRKMMSIEGGSHMNESRRRVVGWIVKIRKKKKPWLIVG